MVRRQAFSDALNAAMKARDARRVSTLRMILARLKETEIAARPRELSDADVLAMLRGMVKSRRESIDLYRQGNRPELVEKEQAEIAVIEAFLPAPMDDAAIARAVEEAVTETGAAGPRDMGKVMATLKARHAGSLDLSRAGPVVKARLGG